MRRGRVDAHGAGQRERLRLRVGLVAVVVVRVVHLHNLATPETHPTVKNLASAIVFPRTSQHFLAMPSSKMQLK